MDKIKVCEGDITQQSVDAIVNAANETLLGGGGVDGAIHRAAGPGLLDDCRRLGGCPPGQSRVTAAHALPARFVIHTVGPVWHGGDADEARTLAACYRHSLDAALKVGARVVAFPAISCGAYGYPADDAVRVAVRAVTNWLARNDGIDEVRFVCFDAKMRSRYEAILAERAADSRVEGETA